MKAIRRRSRINGSLKLMERVANRLRGNVQRRWVKGLKVVPSERRELEEVMQYQQTKLCRDGALMGCLVAIK